MTKKTKISLGIIFFLLTLDFLFYKGTEKEYMLTKEPFNSYNFCGALLLIDALGFLIIYLLILGIGMYDEDEL